MRVCGGHAPRASSLLHHLLCSLHSALILQSGALMHQGPPCRHTRIPLPHSPIRHPVRACLPCRACLLAFAFWICVNTGMLQAFRLHVPEANAHNAHVTKHLSSQVTPDAHHCACPAKGFQLLPFSTPNSFVSATLATSVVSVGSCVFMTRPRVYQ
jgi:hypothetical protein